MTASNDRVDEDTGWAEAAVKHDGDLQTSTGIAVAFWPAFGAPDLTHLAGQRIRYRIQIQRIEGDETVEIPDQIAETERLAREVADIRSLLGVSDVDDVSSVKRRVEELLTAERRVALLEREPWLRAGIGTDESYHEQLSRLLVALGCETTREALDALGREYTVDEVEAAYGSARKLSTNTWQQVSDYSRGFFMRFANALPPRIKPDRVVSDGLDRLRDENTALRVELKSERQELERVTRELEAEQEAHRQTRLEINDALGLDADAAEALKELASWHSANVRAVLTGGKEPHETDWAELEKGLGKLCHELDTLRAPLTEDAAKAWIAENWDAVADPRRWPRWAEYPHNFSSDGSWLQLVLRMLLAFANRHCAPSPDWSAIQAAVASEDMEALRGLVGGES